MFKKPALLVVFLLAFISLYASSWHVGLEAGYSYSIVDTKTIWENTENNNGHGFDISIPVEYSVFDWLSVNSGIRWIMKSSEYLKSVETGIIDEYTKMYHFLEFPLTIRFSFGDDVVKWFIGGGGYLGVRLFDYASGIALGNSLYIDSNGNSYFLIETFSQGIPLSDLDNLFDAGMIAETGFKAYLSSLGYLYASLSYQYGLTSLEKEHRTASHQYFSNLNANLGFMFSL